MATPGVNHGFRRLRSSHRRDIARHHSGNYRHDPNNPAAGSVYHLRQSFGVSFAKSHVSFFGKSSICSPFGVNHGNTGRDTCLFMSLSMAEASRRDAEAREECRSRNSSKGKSHHDMGFGTLVGGWPGGIGYRKSAQRGGDEPPERLRAERGGGRNHNGELSGKDRYLAMAATSSR